MPLMHTYIVEQTRRVKVTASSPSEALEFADESFKPKHKNDFSNLDAKLNTITEVDVTEVLVKRSNV